MTQAAPLALRLTMEGIEVPVISAQIQMAPGQPATATIQIVPTDTALQFLPRTFVNLFFLDSLLSQATSSLFDRLMDEGAVGAFDAEDSRYRLLYSGELIGVNYSKATNQRSVVLQCMDLSSYWDTCYQWFMDYSNHGFLDKTHNFVGAGEYLFDNIASGTRWVLGQILSTRPENPKYANCRGLLGGYIHMLETVGGISPRSTSYEGYRGVNDFFTMAELRYRLTAQIGAVEADVSSARLYQAKAFRSWLRSGMTSCGSLVSFRDLLRVVGQYIFHETYPNPAAKLERGGLTTVKTPRRIVSSTLGSDLARELEDVRKSLADIATAFRSISDGSISKSDGRDPLVSAFEKLKELRFQSDALKITNKASFLSSLNDAVQNVSMALTRLNQYSSVRFEESDYLSAEQGRSVAILVGNARDRLSAAVRNTTKTRTEVRNTTTETSDHLFSQLILPETFFVPPPRCNVLFPDSYTTLNYSRNFMREVSRLSVQGGLGIIAGSSRGANVLGRFYFAPNIPDVRGKMARAEVYKQGTTILPHELHSGIIPKMEWVTDGHRWATRDLRVGESQQERKIRYIQRLANFQFVLHRWNSRRMATQGPFNPNMVLGFPALVLDRTAPAPSALEAIADALGSGWAVLPTAYIGKPEQIVHSLSQAGGNTSIVYAKARTHRGVDDEFLGLLNRERRDLVDEELVVSPQVMVTDAASSGSVNAELVSVLRGYMAGTLKTNSKLTSDLIVGDVPELSESAVRLTRGELNSIGVDNRTYDRYANISLPIGSSAFAPEPVGLSGTSEDSVRLPASITLPVQRRTALGRFVTPVGGQRPEVILKPGWYSPVWEPENISEQVYQPLLGCESITSTPALQDVEDAEAVLRRYMRDNSASPDDLVIERVEGADGAVLGVAKVRGKHVATFVLDGGASVEHAVDALTMLYSTLRQGGSNIDEFVRNYTTRDIATMPEILGSGNLRYDENGNVEVAQDGEPDPVEGFFSRSVGDYNTDVAFFGPQGLNNEGTTEPRAGDGALRLLLTDDQRKQFLRPIYDKGTTLRDATDKPIEVPAYLDPRGRARQRVLAYRAELLGSRGLAGV